MRVEREIDSIGQGPLGDGFDFPFQEKQPGRELVASIENVLVGQKRDDAGGEVLRRRTVAQAEISGQLGGDSSRLRQIALLEGADQLGDGGK